MKLKFVGGLLGLLTAGAVAGGFAALATAKESTVSAMAVWQGEGVGVRVGENEAMIIGLLEGSMFVEDNKGALHTAKMTCPITMVVNRDLSQSGEGRCMVSDIDGDQVFARWTCEGEHFKGCQGPFTLAGGLGKFKGISGGGTFLLRGTMQEVTPGAPGVASQTVVGLATWPELRYRIP